MVCYFGTNDFCIRPDKLLLKTYWLLRVRAEHGVWGVFEKRVLRRIFGQKLDEVRGDCAVVHHLYAL